MHTADNLRFKLSEMIGKLVLPETADVFVNNDNAANITLAVERMANTCPLKCCCHSMQLAIKDCFAEVTGMSANLDLCKRIAEYCNQSVVASDELKKACEDLMVPFSKPQNPNSTRWFSQLLCMESIASLKVPLFSLMGRDDLKFGEMIPTTDQWNMIEVFTNNYILQ